MYYQNPLTSPYVRRGSVLWRQVRGEIALIIMAYSNTNYTLLAMIIEK